MMYVCRAIAGEAVSNICKKSIVYEGEYFCVDLNKVHKTRTEHST